MAFAIPTLPALIDRIKGDMNARMGNTNALLPRSLAFVLAHVLAGATWGLYLYQQWIARQVIPDTAEGAQLERWARLFGITRNPPVKAAGKVDVTGASGSDLLGGSLLQRANAVEYAIVGDWHWTVSETTAVDVEAVEPGTTGNFDWAVDATLDLVSPPAGIVGTCPLRSPGIAGGLHVGFGTDGNADPATVNAPSGKVTEFWVSGIWSAGGIQTQTLNCDRAGGKAFQNCACHVLWRSFTEQSTQTARTFWTTSMSAE